MPLQITVRGSADKRYAPERAIVRLSAAPEGGDKEDVYRQAVDVQDPLTQQLRELVEKGAVATWSSEQVRVYTHRPWGDNGSRLPAVHSAQVAVTAEFLDFERLSGFLDYWAGKDGVEIGGITWDVTTKNRRIYEAEVRRAAVDDAVVKAQAYADALRRGRVQAVELADPGMLQVDPASPLVAKAFADDAPELTLTPADIVINVDVDARFLAD